MGVRIVKVSGLGLVFKLCSYESSNMKVRIVKMFFCVIIFVSF